MKRLFILVSIILTSFFASSQTTLYDTDGIRVSYTTSISKTVFCKEENKTVYFVNLHYSVFNYSAKAVRISSRFQMCSDAFANCLSEDEVFHFEANGRSSFQDNRYLILKSGDSYYGDVGNWYYESIASPCAWGIDPEFAKDGITLKLNIDLKTTESKKTQSTYGISQQGDVITNPQSQTNYSQKQKEEDIATDNAMKAWKNSSQQIQNIQANDKSKKQPIQQTQNQSDEQQKTLAQLDQIKQQAIEQEQHYQQTQIELDNAKNVSMSAYQNAINSGRKESGAMLDATIEGAQQISDPTSSLIYTGIGLGVSLFTRLAEKKDEARERELTATLAEKKEEERRRNEINRKKLLADTKAKFVTEALNINNYELSDLISKQRYATILCVPKTFNSEEQNVAFTYPLQVPEYSDGTHPLKPDIEKELLSSLDKYLLQDKIIYILYPIVDLQTFSNDFVKKMGSGKVISLNAELINFNRIPFSKIEKQSEETDFWGDAIKNKEGKKKEDKKESKPLKKDDDFWNK